MNEENKTIENMVKSEAWRDELPKYWFEYQNNQLQNRLTVIKDVREITNYILIGAITITIFVLSNLEISVIRKNIIITIGVFIFIYWITRFCSSIDMPVGIKAKTALEEKNNFKYDLLYWEFQFGEIEKSTASQDKVLKKLFKSRHWFNIIICTYLIIVALALVIPQNYIFIIQIP